MKSLQQTGSRGMTSCLPARREEVGAPSAAGPPSPPPSPRDLQRCLKVRPVGSACARHRAPPRYTKCACGRTLTDHRSRRKGGEAARHLAPSVHSLTSIVDCRVPCEETTEIHESKLQKRAFGGYEHIMAPRLWCARWSYTRTQRGRGAR